MENTLEKFAIESLIYEIRGKKIMLDKDLARLYGVETKVLNQAVKRNIKRFPEDFMFQLTLEEYNNLKSQIVTSSWGGTRKLPLVFTEQGLGSIFITTTQYLSNWKLLKQSLNCWKEIMKRT